MVGPIFFPRVRVDRTKGRWKYFWTDEYKVPKYYMASIIKMKSLICIDASNIASLNHESPTGDLQPISFFEERNRGILGYKGLPPSFRWTKEGPRTDHKTLSSTYGNNERTVQISKQTCTY